MPKRTRDYRIGLLQELRDPEAAVHYLNAALEDSEELFLMALRDVSEAHHMASIANGAGLSRESLYRMLSETGNPRYSSLTNILRALGLKLAIEKQIDPGQRVLGSKELAPANPPAESEPASVTVSLPSLAVLAMPGAVDPISIFATGPLCQISTWTNFGSRPERFQAPKGTFVNYAPDSTGVTAPIWQVAPKETLVQKDPIYAAGY